MKKSVKGSILLLILVGVLATVAWVSSEQNVSASPKVGYHAPSFSLPKFPDNQPISLADYQGKPVFINFWATWCPPCQAETPDLVKAYSKYGDKVQFIGVNLTSQDSLTDVTAFIKKYGIKYPTALDTKGTVAQQYQALAIPTSFIINRQGIIVDRYVGALTPQVLEWELQRISQ